ncbi:MAG: hypothetical protein HQL87_03840 [Magnetococcales bacterium]|nr:hypothetical protein [Magnetococcales bacterium]
MNDAFFLRPDWAPTAHGPAEIRQTSGSLHIRVHNRSLTRVQDDWAQSVRDTVQVASYPLAVWLAASWWRLCWEPAPERTPQTDWCLSHDMHGAGHGFLWPPLRFESDGEMVTLVCTPSRADSHEPIRYLTQCRESIPVSLFMEGVAAFIQTVLARLDVVGVPHTALHLLWQAVTQEQRDPRTASYRRLEALLGFDPDDAPDSIAEPLSQLSKKAGEAAVAELAAACARRRDPALMWADIEQSLGCQGVWGTLAGMPAVPGVDASAPGAPPPWERGRALARATRTALGLGLEPVADRLLCDLLGLTVRDLTEGDAPLQGMPWSLAIRAVGGERAQLLFRSNHYHGRRFEGARWLGDAWSAPVQDRWLPATGTRMARQKRQRAFAAELLAPIAAVQAYLGDDLTDEDRVLEAGDHFGVSPLTIRSQLANHGLIVPETGGGY